MYKPRAESSAMRFYCALYFLDSNPPPIPSPSPPLWLVEYTTQNVVSYLVKQDFGMNSAQT